VNTSVQGKEMHSTVEQTLLVNSGAELKYEPTEKIGALVVDSFPELGALAALRFLEWVQDHHGGVISLPTGKTPEYFIKEVQRLLNSWNTKNVQEEIERWGLNPAKRPDMKSLSFVQIDEFYPISPLQHNSFYHYVNKYYIEGLDLNAEHALLINCSEIGLPDGKDIDDVWPGRDVDLTLRYRRPSSMREEMQKKVLENIDQWCNEYEEKIRSRGGIGFFLGGIGPDGHIGFNISGSDLFSATRLTQTNYETQAAAATDLGGIEVARKRHVITIGLSTIVYNPECVALIIAAGDSKAQIVADSIQHPQHIHYPATALQLLPNARFYLTRGAAKHLEARQVKLLGKTKSITKEQMEKIVIDLSLKRKKPVRNLSSADLQNDLFGNELLKKYRREIPALKQDVEASLKQKIQAGIDIRKNAVFMHTEPHHDDIMLGYLPAVVRHVREHSTKHYFLTFTSGFTAVTNRFMLEQLEKLKDFLGLGAFHNLLNEDYFNPVNTVGKNRDVWQYLDGVAAGSPSMMDEGRLRRLLRNLIYLYDETDVERIRDRIDELINYFKTQYPGRKDLPHIQALKGMSREWEGDCLWGYFGWHSDSVFHLKLGFYSGDMFSEEPTVERDVLPILEILKKIKPDVVSVALDPEASGPDTHYKALQALTEALRMYERDGDGNENHGKIKIWGYRNVWYRFHPAEVNMFIPVSLNMFALQDSAFHNSFISQKDASFPSHEHDGPFSELAQKIQVEQYQMMKNCLGRAYFYEHEDALIRATRGFVFLKEMDLEEFYLHSRSLRKCTENL
jgi:glucosamine-6-phosphate deaminase